MGRQLTPEFAEGVSLSHNPFKRHRQVSEMLQDQSLIGGDAEITIAPNNKLGVIDVHLTDFEHTINIQMISPFLGKRALVKTANALHYADNSSPTVTKPYQ